MLNLRKVCTRIARNSFCLLLAVAIFLPYNVATAASTGMAWPNATVTAFAPASGGAWYPRLVKLSATDWLVSFDTNVDGGFTKVKVAKSTNAGQSWGAPVVVASDAAGDVGNAQMLRLTSGEIWLAYRVVVQSGSTTNTYLKVRKSTDNGATWSDLSGGQIASATATSFKGLWEPHLGYIGSTIAVMYADDSPAVAGTGGKQNLYMRTWNGSAWNSATMVSDGVAAGSRDGMPVFAQMSDGRYITVFEASDVAGYPFVIKYKISNDGLNWSGARQTLYIPTKTGKKAGAPFVVKLGDGRLMTSFQTDEDSANTGDNYSSMRTLISSNNGSTWQYKHNVFPVSDTTSSNWNALMAVDSNTVVAATSANFPSTGIFLRFGNATTPTNKNLANNWGFETANVNGWTTFNDDYPQRIIIHGLNDGIARAPGGGNYFVGLSGISGPATAYIGQTITGLDNGTYTMRAYARRSSGQNSAVMEVKDYGGTMLQTSLPVTGTWTQVTISNIQVTNGQATIGFYVSNNNANQWADIDNVEFFKN
ncbi:exo-alpha-sialidase [Paenibacillus sp. BC26]|uniref:exo-alpha-sialidase n=1 Tax=Paenibacillus sp. BC26 TaxID=1881032 RepID=UPI000B85834B|nr:exo-alpha-sialidase [Paenibacillus sp. BC26]